MCIAIFKPEGVKIEKEVLENCFINNDDGAGYAVMLKRGMKVKKGFFEFDRFYQSFSCHMDCQAIIHFRIATHGTIEETSCHPFVIDKKVAVCHNGILSNMPGVYSEYIGSSRFKKDLTPVDLRSDTQIFCDDILTPLIKEHPGFWRTGSGKRLIELAIGPSNKLIMLDSMGNAVIFNEDKGVWDDDCWFSNTSYMTAAVSMYEGWWAKRNEVKTDATDDFSYLEDYDWGRFMK